MGLWIEIEDSGASTAEIQRGVTAALEVFKAAGAKPGAVWDVLQGDNSADYDKSLELWNAAETAAFATAFDGWLQVPAPAALVWEG